MSIDLSPFRTMIEFEWDKKEEPDVFKRWEFTYSYVWNSDTKKWQGTTSTTYDGSDPSYNPTVHPYRMVESWDGYFISWWFSGVRPAPYGPPYQTRLTKIRDFNYNRLFGSVIRIASGQYSGSDWSLEILTGRDEERRENTNQMVISEDENPLDVWLDHIDPTHKNLEPQLVAGPTEVVEEPPTEE